MFSSSKSKDTPLKSVKKVSHVLKSARTPMEIRTLWCGKTAPDMTMPSRLQNVCPALTTWHAKFRKPKSCCTARNAILFSPIAHSRHACISATFASGSRAIHSTESNSIPKKVSLQLGPAVFSGAKGTPKCRAILWNCVRALPQSPECARPRNSHRDSERPPCVH